MIPLMTVREVAQVLGFSPHHVRRLALAGKLKSVKFGSKSVRFVPSDVEAFIKEGRRARGTEEGRE